MCNINETSFSVASQMRYWVRYQGNVTEIKSQSFLNLEKLPEMRLKTISKNITHKRHTQKSNQSWLHAVANKNKAATACVNSCSLWLLLMHLRRPLHRTMPLTPLLNHCKTPPHPPHCPQSQKSSVECTSSSPTTTSCPSFPPATATWTYYEKSEIVHF